ncbi:GATA zinc finger domain-containing protein 14-like isoform X2 [Aricia agestis]|uniref:GATA zinc finger domain-containing protein 14-like isoform X2 n=1 Tax=Aricia agestis TaxID=91739 RepID=UPI001C206EB6|nr:GATA zinc finger domain-containing protein 14-like isoform X2 [Aricia agestis]
MRLLILLASIGAIVIAKPEKYREKEDFEYSRSSSDDGTKAGFYGAQRGNMGGNYEHAHNMDMLAQHQMSSLVRQVDGELGTGANQRTGSVFTSGSSRGVYGSGMYDLSNLKGRNFDESHAFGGSHSSLSSSSGAATNLGFGHEHASSDSRYSSSQSQSAIERSRYRHHSSAESSSDLVMGGHREESLHGGMTQSEYDQQAASNYYSGSNGYNSNGRYVNSVPAKVYIRPGQKVTIPISSQTYDASHYNAHLHDENSVNSDAEIISSGHVVSIKPVVKHYESSYKYKKEWEKHDTQTFATPTENPFPQNIENFDSLQVSQGLHHRDNFDVNSHSSSQLNKFNSAHSNAYSTGSKASSFHQSGYNSGLTAESQNLDSSFAGSHSKDYLHAGIGAGNMVEDISSRPKHYQSSYSYHKAWERQGDPYVIVPDSSAGGSEVQSSQKFTAASENYGQSSSHHGSHYSQSQKGYSSGCSIDCVNGHIRVARSYKPDAENLEQQSQTEWANVEDLGQQTQEKWENLDNLGQQVQENWDHVGDLTQQQQSKWETQEDLGQKSQNVWDNLDNLSQQSQTKWDKIEVLDQQKENKNDKQVVGQKPQNSWDKLKDLEQKPNVKPFDLHKESPNTQESVSDRPRYVTWGEYQNFGQQAQNSWNNGDHVHHDHHHRHIVHEDQSNKYNNMHDMFNQEFENWKLMQSIYSQHLANKQRENYYNSFGNNINTQQGGYQFGHRHGSNCHHSQDASLINTNYQNSWNTFGQEHVHYKHFSDFWNNQHTNGDIFTTQQEPHLVPTQTMAENNKEDFSIHNFWDKLDKIDNTEQTQNIHQFNVDKSTEQTVNKQTESKLDFEKNVNINEDMEESLVVHPVDVGRGDIGAEDLTSESLSTEQNKDKGTPSSTVIINKETKYHNLDQSSQKAESHDRTTTEDSLDLSVVGLENVPSETKYNQNSYNKKPKDNTEIENTSQVSSKPSNVEKINQEANYMQHNADQQFVDWMRQPNSGHESEDFGQQQNNDQQLENFTPPNTDQQLEDFGQQQNNNQQLEDFKTLNTDQQLDDFGKQQNNDQQLEDYKHPSTDQKLEDFAQQQNNDQQLEDFKTLNTDQQLEDFAHQQKNQQLEDFKKLNTDQQLEDFGQQQNSDQQLEDFKHFNTDQQLEDFIQQQTNDQQLEDFKKLNADQQLEDFGQQQNNDQQLEDFKQQHTDQQLEDFKQSNTDQQLEDFGQQQTNDQQLDDFGQQVQDQQLETFGEVNKQHQGFDFEHTQHFTQEVPNNEKQQERKIYAEDRSLPKLQAHEEQNSRLHESVIPPEPVVTTEKPGFWKSVGNKFTGAKDTVAGWFKRS